MQAFGLITTSLPFAFIYTTIAHVIPIKPVPEPANAIVIPECSGCLPPVTYTRGPLPGIHDSLIESGAESVHRGHVEAEGNPAKVELSDGQSAIILEPREGVNDSCMDTPCGCWRSPLVTILTTSDEPTIYRSPVLEMRSWTSTWTGRGTIYSQVFYDWADMPASSNTPETLDYNRGAGSEFPAYQTTSTRLSFLDPPWHRPLGWSSGWLVIPDANSPDTSPLPSSVNHEVPTTLPGAPPRLELPPSTTTSPRSPMKTNAFETNPFSKDKLAIRVPTFPEPTPPPSAILKENPMCVFLGAAIGICHSLTPGFNTLNPSVQAHCLCYSSTVWAPNIFDGAVGQCAGFASTAAPEAYAPLANLEGFCESIGDIEGPNNAVVTTTYTKVVASQTNPGCVAVTNSLMSCMGKTAGFEDMEPKDQAKCLCYDVATSWAPTQFDNAVSTCAEYAKTAEPAYAAFYPGVTPLVGFCISAGDVLSMPNSTSMITSPSPTPALSNGGPTLTESDTTLDTTVTIRATKTPAIIESNKGTVRKVGKVEVVGISFCCAAVLLFLW